MENSDPTALLRGLLELRAELVADGLRKEEQWQLSLERTDFAASARNLAQYLALRERDLRELQTALMPGASHRSDAWNRACSRTSTP